ncbi:putative formate transporter 1 [uncultured spirochete]|uniref:Putative formate transporter 1 n=1 Tax=uncultured spirochete TaxID=156406 RepID=A0A3P3XQ11_9SPIR|nr:formate/nitrite transporter family protein [Spirochaetaceae bacterium]SLM18377.1 putative formate transporter 1 [uncultured spirochete]
MEKAFLSPAETAMSFIETGLKKTTLPVFKQFLSAILGGAFIAFAAEGSNVAVHTIASVGLSKALAGAIFSTGLMMVVIGGAELFTGNTLIVIACGERKISLGVMLKSWLCVYLGNFVGAMIIVFLILYSGQLDFSNGLLGGFTIKIAAYKTHLAWGHAFFLGILCNWLVCMAIWMASGAKDTAGKILAIFFPIWLFVTSGFEHSIANMYYIPAGILAKANHTWATAALALGATQEQIEGLTWGSFIVKNLVPVTLGNIVGGGLFVGIIYWFIYLHKAKEN